MTLGELRALPPGAPVWVLHTPHGVEEPTYDQPVHLKFENGKWEGEGAILNPLAAKDYEWSDDTRLDWWDDEGHFEVFHVES
jgi:hypothetical protein